MKKGKYLILLVIAIIVAGILAIGMGVLCYSIGSNNEEFQPFLCFLFGAIAAYLLYRRLKESYDRKMALTVGITSFVVLSLIFGLLQIFSSYAILVVESIAWSLVTLAIAGFIIYKIWGVSKDEYNNLED